MLINRMKKIILIYLIILIATLQSCGQTYTVNEDQVKSESQSQTILNPKGKTLETRILPPQEYQRIKVEGKSFAKFLRELPVKPSGTEVRLHTGKFKGNYGIYCAVVDLPIGDKNLHQCADAIMRLRAEYLYSQGKYDEIHFNLTNGFRVDYSEWMKGKRVIAKANQTYWQQTTSPSNTYTNLWNYLELVFTYAGTLSLEKELKPITIADLDIGDIFIKGGSPGHAVIIVDVAVDSTQNSKVFLLAQSFMPAQEIQILENPRNKNISPWYSTDIRDSLITPEWPFLKEEIRRFH